MFASNTAQRADADGNHRQAGFASEENVEMDPEYAPKRALTTKVQFCLIAMVYVVLSQTQQLRT